MNAKITVTVLIAFLIVFFSLIYFGEWYNTLYDVYRWQNEFYNQNLETEQQRIFLYGSSYVGQLNATRIEDYISKNGKDYQVYNLATNNQVPKKTAKWLPQILSLEPKIVVFGLGYRDFGVADSAWLSELGTSPTKKPESFLPDPQQIFSDLIQLEMIFGYDFDNIKNPKFVTLNAVFKAWVGPKYLDITPEPDSPFYVVDEDEEILTESELANVLTEKPIFKYRGIVPPEKNVNLLLLKKIVKELQDNDVEVIIFTVPLSSYYLETIPESDKQIFNEMLNELSSELNLEIYELQKKYHGQEIWRDVTHISYLKEASIYSEDVAEIILKSGL